MPRRGRNIYQRKDGRWEGRVRKEGLPPGEKKYKSVYGKTYGEVKKKLETLKREMETLETRCTISMEEAVRIWLKEKRGSWKETTYAAYRHVAEKYIIPGLGTMALSEIDSHVLEAFVSDIRQQGRKGELTKNYLFHVCSIVLKVMTYLRKKKQYNLVVPENPVSREKKVKATLPGEGTMARLEEYLLKNVWDETALGILTALHTGVRIGELCALSWEDIDLDEKVIHIRKNIQRVKNFDSQKNKTELVLSTPKSADSVRDIPIPSMIFDILCSCNKQASMPFLSGGKNMYMDPRTLQYRFENILKKCGIEHFNFHMLRHAFATRCVEKGFDIKSLSEILGHSNVQITMNLYVHSSMKQKQRLMDMLGSYSMEGYAVAV